MHRLAQMRMRACILFVLAALVAALAACVGGVPRADSRQGELHPPMAAASEVARADGGKGPREHRVIPLRPMSGDVEILYGDPEAIGEPFVMRIRELPGTVVPPHSYPVDEHITVVQGIWYFGLGEEFNPQALAELKAGTYAFAPKGSWMFGYSPEGAIVQVHGVGPFQINWHGGLKTLDDPNAKATFRFGRGAPVVSGRGTGRIVEGYASGKLIQYEIEGSNGERFMAHEHELRYQ
jgi:quercetin dioxygenase-like cupin family protein